MLAVLAVAGLVGVFGGGYALGHHAPRHVPAVAARSTTSLPATSVPDTSATLATASTPTTFATTFPTDELGAVEFFTSTGVEPTITGCSENLDFAWTFDPAKTPPDLTDVVIAVDGPGVSSTHHVAAFLGKLEFNLAVNLEVGQGTWTAVVVSVGTQSAVPQPISIDVSGC